MNTDWQVNVFVLVNASVDISESGENDAASEALTDVTFDLGQHPSNCSLEYFDRRDSWGTDDAVGIAYMAKLTYEYNEITEKSAKSKVLDDFQNTHFAFESPSDEVEYEIDFIAAWAFFDLQNPNEEDDGDVDEEFLSDGVMPNSIYGFGLDVEGDEDFVGSSANWYLTSDGAPTF